MELQALRWRRTSAGMTAASIDRTPAFLDPLLGGAVEGNDVLGRRLMLVTIKPTR
jgi:hypothetical protein